LAARAATAAFRSAREQFDREELAEKVQMGADGTLTTRLDILVDTAVAEVIKRPPSSRKGRPTPSPAWAATGTGSLTGRPRRSWCPGPGER
jgi:hypothetical protein